MQQFLLLHEKAKLLTHISVNRIEQKKNFKLYAMKKTIASALVGLTSLTLHAQVEVTTKNFDLESQDKHKNWLIRGANVDSVSGQTQINFVQPKCNASHSSDGSNNYTTYRGMSHKVDRLIFDANFDYVKTENKEYGSTAEAMLSNELLFGKKYNVPYDPFFPYMIDNSFMFTTVVTYGFSAGKEVVSSIVGLKVQGCSEIPARYEVNSAANRQSKEEKWYPMYSNPVPNGGNILYSTVGVLKEEKQHYVFRKFDKDINLIREQTFTFDYQCLMQAKAIERSPGVFDYVFIATPYKYKKSKLRVAAANQYEYFYVDGTTYEIKEHVVFTAPNTKWTLDKVIHENNATYLIGGCSANNTDYTELKGPTEDVYQNLQVAKFENGKLIFIKSTLNKDLVAALKVNDQYASNSKISVQMAGSSLHLVNNQLIYQGRQFKAGKAGVSVLGQPVGGSGFLGIQAFIINDQGTVETILSKKGENIGSSVSFSKDGQKVFWFSYDMGKYNKFKDGMMYANKSKFLISGLSVISFDLSSQKIANYQDLVNDDWAISYANPILMETDDKILMLGHKITKKAKESEIVFITIKK